MEKQNFTFNLTGPALQVYQAMNDENQQQFDAKALAKLRFGYDIILEKLNDYILEVDKEELQKISILILIDLKWETNSQIMSLLKEKIDQIQCKKLIKEINTQKTFKKVDFYIKNLNLVEEKKEEDQIQQQQQQQEQQKQDQGEAVGGGEEEEKQVQQQKLVKQTFIWIGNANEVFLVGEFTEWEKNKILMDHSEDKTKFRKVVELPLNQKYNFKFIVDGQWKTSPQHEITQVDNNQNNWIMVKDEIIQIFKPVINEEKKQYSCEFQEQKLQILLDNFDKEKEVAIICAAGTIGSGKSTLLNVIAHTLDQSITQEIFETSSGLVSFTEGMWVYPYPLFLKDKPNMQILLCDMEGQGALKGKDGKKIQILLKQFYFLGMILSSQFILCIFDRINQMEIDLLIEMYNATQGLQQQLGIQVPQITVFLKAKQNLPQKYIDEFKANAIKSGVPEQILNLLQFRPGHQLNSEFTEQKIMKSLFTAPENKDYLEEVQQFLSLLKPNQIFCQLEPSRIGNCINILREAQGFIKCNKDFVFLLGENLIGTIRDNCFPILFNLEKKYKSQIELEAQQWDFQKKTYEQFETQVEKLINNAIKEFEQWFAQKISIIPKSSIENEFLKVKKQNIETLVSHLKGNTGLQIINSRKLEFEKIQLEELKQAQMKEKEEYQQKIQELKNKNQDQEQLEKEIQAKYQQQQKDLEEKNLEIEKIKNNKEYLQQQVEKQQNLAKQDQEKLIQERTQIMEQNQKLVQQYRESQENYYQSQKEQKQLVQKKESEIRQLQYQYDKKFDEYYSLQDKFNQKQDELKLKLTYQQQLEENLAQITKQYEQLKRNPIIVTNTQVVYQTKPGVNKNKPGQHHRGGRGGRR